MYCKHCGALIDDDSRVCPYCGQPQASQQAPAQQAPVYAQPVQQQPIPQQPIYAAPVQPAPAPAPAPVEKPTGIKKIFLLVGSIAAFLAVLLAFGMLFLSGVQVNTEFGSFSEGFFYNVADYFDYSETGIIEQLTNLAEGGDAMIGQLISLIFSYVLIYALIISLFVYFIMGIVAFVKAMKGTDYEKIGKVASRAFETLTVGMLIFLILHVVGGEDGTVTLNGAALAGIIISALLVATNFVMHLLTRGFGLINLKRLLSLGFTLLILASGAIIAGLASGATFVVSSDFGSQSYGMFTLFTQSITLLATAGGYAPDVYAEMLVYSMFGFLSAILVVSFGVELIRIAMNNVQALGDNKPEKMGGLGMSITALIFSIISVVVHFLYADASEASDMFSPAIPIVVAVFAVVSIVMSVLAKKFAQSVKK